MSEERARAPGLQKEFSVQPQGDQVAREVAAFPSSIVAVENPPRATDDPPNQPREQRPIDRTLYGKHVLVIGVPADGGLGLLADCVLDEEHHCKDHNEQHETPFGWHEAVLRKRYAGLEV